VALYGCEQSDFHDCHFETDGLTTSGNLYLSYANTPGFVSPYVNLVSPGTSMTKINVSGGRSVFGGTGKMVVLDQGSSGSDYTISIRDAYINMGNNSVFLSDTGTGALRHIVLDTVYAEVGTTNAAMVTVVGPAWNWRIDNAQIYNGTGLTVSPYKFANGFLDGEVLIDSTGQTAGYSNPEFNSSSCAGSVLHLGQQQPTTNCTNYASLNSVSGYTPGITANGSGLYQNIAAPSATWMKLGTWTGTGPGDTLHITMDSTGGESALGNNQGFAEIVAAISNGLAAPNLTGATAYIWSAKPPITALTLAATGGSTSATNLSWDVWINVAPYAFGFYGVYVSSGATWTNNDTSGTPPNGAFVVTGSIANTNLSVENSSAGQATCWKTTGAIGYCSSAITSTGSCTCN